MQRKNEYVYVGDTIPKITQEQHADFICNYQKSILFALVERKLLTPSQCDQCLEELKCQFK